MSGKNTLSILNFPDERKNLSEGARWIISEIERINGDNKEESTWKPFSLTRAIISLVRNIIALTDEELVAFGERIETVEKKEPNVKDTILAILLIKFPNMKDENEGKRILLEDDLLKSPFSVESEV